MYVVFPKRGVFDEMEAEAAPMPDASGDDEEENHERRTPVPDASDEENKEGAIPDVSNASYFAADLTAPAIFL